MSEFAHHLDWLREVEEFLTQAGSVTSAERKQLIATCEHVLSQNPQSTVAQDLLLRITGVSASVQRMISPSAENPESALMKEVVAEAVRLGIVREEIFPAKESSALPAAYLLSSSHPAHDNEPNTEETNTICSQVELFRLAHLIHRSGIKTPIYVEGRTLEQSYTAFPIVRPALEKSNRTIDIHDPEAQAFFFDHPDELAAVMHQYMGIAKQHQLALPIFYAFTAYPHIQGAHTKATNVLVENFFNVWLPFHAEFMNKYRPFLSGLEKNSSGMVDMKIPTGWTSDGNPVLHIGNNWITAQDLIREFEGYLTYTDAFAAVDTAREEDLADIFECKMAGEMPMGFAGKGHERRIANLVTTSRPLHVLTPTSSIQHDHLRRELPINDPKCALLYVDLAQKMIAIARSIKKRDVQ